MALVVSARFQSMSSVFPKMRSRTNICVRNTVGWKRGYAISTMLYVRVCGRSVSYSERSERPSCGRRSSLWDREKDVQDMSFCFVFLVQDLA